MRLIHGDCLEEMDKLIQQGVIVDSIICDPPYGITQCKWDSIIPLEEMWKRLNTLINPNGAIVFTSTQPFTSMLVMSNIDMFRYSIVWEKTTATGHLNAKKMPMRAHEDILVFYKKLPTYNPQKTYGHKRKEAIADRAKKESDVYGKQKGVTSYSSTERYPRSVIRFSTDKQKSKLHPTQKPIALMEYLIKTYTNEGETVLDFTMGSGTTGLGCRILNRKFIGIELDKKYFEIAEERLITPYVQT